MTTDGGPPTFLFGLRRGPQLALLVVALLVLAGLVAIAIVDLVAGA